MPWAAAPKPAGKWAGSDPIRAEAVRALYVQMHNTAAAAAVITVYMMAVSWPFTPWPRILAWAAASCGNMVAREALIRAYNRRVRADAELERWARLYVAHQVLTGLVWGITIFLFAHLDQPITIALTLCCLYSIAAGAVPAQSYTPASLYALVGVLYSFILIRFVSTGQFIYIMVGVTSALFGLTMVGFCRVQARTLNEGFRIRFENRALVEALTEQKARAEDERHKAELANLAKSQFLAAASHDLRQPLYALSLFSASLRELKLDSQSRSVVAGIEDSIAVMESLFDGLLDISKLEAGVVRPRLAAVSIDAVFDRLSQVFRPIALDRGLDLRFRSDGEWVRSDATLLEQVLSNLVSNAIRCTVRGAILVAARRRRGAIALEVWDTGIGIAADDRKRIFDEFVQLDNDARDRRKGLGLGLSIARRSAALIGTTIEVASRSGQGSRFAIAQPEASPAVAALASLSIATPSAASGRVLLVDDDHDVRAALADLLSRWGVAFDAFPGAEAALHCISRGARYVLVLADYRLGGHANGLDLLAAVAAQHPAPLPARVLVTGDFDPALIGAAHAQDVALLHKPLARGTLRKLLGLPAD